MKKSDLEALRWRKENVQLLRSQIAELDDSIQCARIAKISDMPKGTPNADLWEEVIDRKDEIKARYVKELRELLEEIQKVDDWLETLSERHKTLIRLRFYEGRGWQEICDYFNVEWKTPFYWMKQLKLK